MREVLLSVLRVRSIQPRMAKVEGLLNRLKSVEYPQDGTAKEKCLYAWQVRDLERQVWSASSILEGMGVEIDELPTLMRNQFERARNDIMQNRLHTLSTEEKELVKALLYDKGYHRVGGIHVMPIE